MKFEQLAQQCGLVLLKNNRDIAPEVLAELACEYANALGREIAKRLPPTPVPPASVGFDAQELIAKSNALFRALEWNQTQSRNWLAAHFNGKTSRLHLSDRDLQKMIFLLLDELANQQKQEAA